MAVDAHVEALQRRHADLEHQLNEIITLPSADSWTITRLKREKLRVKDEIFRLSKSELAHQTA
jgi:hypothetical protein